MIRETMRERLFMQSAETETVRERASFRKMIHAP